MILSAFKKLLLFGFIVLSAISYSQNKLKDTYPAPKADNLLFYLQRTKNKNTIIYELNTLANGTINQQEPVHACWLRYEEGGKRMELSYVQKKLAFGIDAVTDKQKDNYILNFVSYKGRNIFLQKHLINNKQKYIAFITINGKISELKSIFINAMDNFWGYPVVKSIELFGIDIKTGDSVYEKIPI